MSEKDAMNPHEAVIYLSSATSKPRYVRFAYTSGDGHFYLRVRYVQGALQCSTRDELSPRFKDINRNDQERLLEWIGPRRCYKVDESEAKKGVAQ